MTTKKRAVIVTRRFDVSAERVFDAWLDPETARKWLFTTGEGALVRAEVDARVGGRFAFVDRRDDVDVEHVGEYLEIDRPDRLVFSFAVPMYSPEYDRVTIEIRRLDKGCELTLTNEMSPGIYEEWGEGTKEGWTKMLGTLAERLEA
ncbi:SRPBCC domain-containing protein [Aquamicrobium sp. LC103]|uniref:SRPBCC family protein n=1 Tax=Aquamicrobium sp. LC103 TaxID=1120658 RepID=UPI00063EB411|nr:SRPBCC domain-containing protein [Aquamicrobium sp. LC103]TKT82576.1 SRPBCC domain-containing protein [Aquamicrobium sp. LC103]